MIEALFAGFGAVLVASSLMVILHKNAVTSALFLVLAFCSLAGIYLLMGAEFIGMVQIVVYAGAIMVLFLFVIMYLNLRHDVETGVQVALRRGLGWVLGAVLLAEGALFMGKKWALGPVSQSLPQATGGNTESLGMALFSKWIFPFELIAMILLVAMVGVIVVARGLKSSGEGS